SGHFEFEPAFAEIADLDSDIDGREGPGERHCLAQAHLLGGIRARNERQRHNRDERGQGRAYKMFHLRSSDVARIERSEIRGRTPRFARLNAGYKLPPPNPTAPRIRG